VYSAIAEIISKPAITTRMTNDNLVLMLIVLAAKIMLRTPSHKLKFDNEVENNK
jgi:hypothetical protein